VAVRSKASICGRSTAGFASRRGHRCSSLRPADRQFRGALPGVSNCVSSINLNSDAAWTTDALLRPQNKIYDLCDRLGLRTAQLKTWGWIPIGSPNTSFHLASEPNRCWRPPAMQRNVHRPPCTQFPRTSQRLRYHAITHHA
jgi:hypothetical protein